MNRGGQLAIDNIVGREHLIEQLWRELEQTSVVLTGERRTGKTCVLKKMHQERPTGVLTFFQDLEGVHSPTELVEEVLRTVTPALSAGQQARKKVESFLNAIGGIEIAGVVKLPESAAAEWKVLLPKLLSNLLDHHGGTLVFFWDEFPQMLHNVAQANPADAMEILDLLRSARQHHPRLRFVLTGSIGFHAVVDLLRRHGYRNAPINDAYAMTLPPLAPEPACALVRSLLGGEGVDADDPDSVALEVATEAGRIPFYIHHIVGEMRGRAGVRPGTAMAIVDECLRRPEDPWGLCHYRTRLDSDYAQDDRLYALAVLDVLCTVDAPLPFEELRRRCFAQPGVTDVERLRAVLRFLEQDHYVARSADPAGYGFRTTLIARWWRMDRDL